MKTNSRGFTLIELLVVIAIIGILSSVVLASLTSARSKGTDAAIQSELSNMRAQAELYYSNAGSYGPALAATTCPTASANPGNLFSTTTTGGLWSLVSSVDSKVTGTLNCVVGASGANWVIAAQTSSGFWCADSSGNSISTSSATLTGVSACR